MQATNRFEDLINLIKILRKECPWDRKQTHDSIKDNLIEEAYEAVEAIDQRNFEEFKKELGDLLLHIVFQTNMAEEDNHFDISDVIFALQEKLIRRHPHVFEQAKVSDENDVAQNWEQIKLDEGRHSILDGIPKHLPALIKAQRMQEKASNAGFDWSEPEGAWQKFEEELSEFKETLRKNDHTHRMEEFGDLLFTLVNYGRFFDLNAEDALRRTNRKFQRRFQFVEQSLADKQLSLHEASLEEMELHWQEAKKDE